MTMFEKMLKKNNLILKLIMAAVTAAFVGWCAFLSLQALNEANREAAERAKAN